ncbi:hypothetical protein AVEN_182612-1, partial [Araneus ventricosus]
CASFSYVLLYNSASSQRAVDGKNKSYKIFTRLVDLLADKALKTVGKMRHLDSPAGYSLKCDAKLQAEWTTTLKMMSVILLAQPLTQSVLKFGHSAYLDR